VPAVRNTRPNVSNFFRSPLTCTFVEYARSLDRPALNRARVDAVLACDRRIDVDDEE